MIKTKEWGEFFPASTSLFGYNETVAQQYFPLTKNEALEKAFNWSEYNQALKDVTKTINASDVPDKIEAVNDEILKSAIKCEKTGKLFRILKQELDFYRKQGLPIPLRHPEQRFLDRAIYRNSPQLRSTNCPHCNNKIQTTFKANECENVFCEKCYLQEIF